MALRTNYSRSAKASRTWNRRASFAGCALIALTVLSLTFLTLAESPSANTAAIQRGRTEFQSSCGFCHGPEATGARGPDLVRSKLVADDVGGNRIGQVILNGRPTKGMPAFTMTKEQIADIAAFLHSRVGAAIHSAGVSNSYPLSRLLTGNAEQGKAYFNGAGGCKACHSVTGDLAHIAGKYAPIELEVRMLYPRGSDHSTVTVTLPSGEKLEGKLVHLDEFSVAFEDSSGWHRSFSRKQVKVQVHDPLAAHQTLLSKLTQADVHNLFAYLETLK